MSYYRLARNLYNTLYPSSAAAATAKTRRTGLIMLFTQYSTSLALFDRGSSNDVEYRTASYSFGVSAPASCSRSGAMRLDLIMIYIYKDSLAEDFFA